MTGNGDKKKKRGTSAPSTANLFGGTMRQVKPKPPKAKKKKKPKVVNYGKARGMKKTGFGKGRRTSASCRN